MYTRTSPKPISVDLCTNRRRSLVMSHPVAMSIATISAAADLPTPGVPVNKTVCWYLPILMIAKKPATRRVRTGGQIHTLSYGSACLLTNGAHPHLKLELWVWAGSFDIHCIDFAMPCQSCMESKCTLTCGNMSGAQSMHMCTPLAILTLFHVISAPARVQQLLNQLAHFLLLPPPTSPHFTTPPRTCISITKQDVRSQARWYCGIHIAKPQDQQLLTAIKELAQANLLVLGCQSAQICKQYAQHTHYAILHWYNNAVADQQHFKNPATELQTGSCIFLHMQQRSCTTDCWRCR